MSKKSTTSLSTTSLRVISGIVLGLLIVTAIFWLPVLFYILMLLIALGMLNEWFKMASRSIPDLLVGLIVIPLAIGSLLLINVKEDSQWILLTYFAIIWSVDTFAMIAGKSLKGPKLAPQISPNKTWSGLLVGVASSGVVAILTSKLPGFNMTSLLFDNRQLMFSAMFIAVTGQISDLFVSYFKRKFHLKDSGTIIPGHGGVLDRFDSILLTAPILCLVIFC